MSAWYVLGAISFYPVCPGDGVYILGSPLFRGTTISLDRAWITYEEIVAGGRLELRMGSVPQTHWATAREQRPGLRQV